MRKIVYYLLLVCTAYSPHIYARSKVKVHERVRVHEIEIVPPLPSYHDSEYYELNHIEIAPSLPLSPCNNNKGKCCSSKNHTDCCFRRNRKNTIENQQAYIAIATVVFLGIATLGMIFVSRDSH